MAIADVGSNSNSIDHIPVTITLNGTLGAVDSANVKCWHDTLAGGAPTATDIYLEVLEVGVASSISVTS